MALAMPSMRPAPVAAGFQPFAPGSVWVESNVACSANPRRDRLSVIPLAVINFTNSRRDGRMLASLGRSCARVDFSGWMNSPREGLNHSLERSTADV
jgi:hypothetical protein